MAAIVKKISFATMKAKGIILTIFCYFNLACAKAQYQESFQSFWKDVKPGELLALLDTITSSTHHLRQPTQVEEVNMKNYFPKQSTINNRFKRTDEGSVESLEEKIPYDYDKAYEEFVKKYFEDAVTDALSASDSAENVQHEAETNSDEDVYEDEDDEPIKEASKKSAETKKCKNIVRGQQNCLLCKNSRNGEFSETCSYNKETKPQSYKFEKQKNYRKYRATPKKSKTEDSTENLSTEKTNILVKKPITPHKSNMSSCVITKPKNKICYLCENSIGEKTTKCYAEEIEASNNLKKQIRDNKKN